MKATATFGIIVAYAIAGSAVLFMAFGAWFAAVWGFNPLAIFPLYVIGLVVFGGCIVTAKFLNRRHKNNGLST